MTKPMRPLLLLLPLLCIPLPGQRPDGPLDGQGPGPGRGGPQGPINQRQELLPRFDLDGDGRLDAKERAAAREHLKQQRAEGGGRRGRGFPGGNREPVEVQPGPRVSPADVAAYPDRPLYDPEVVRTLFLEFPNDDWYAELNDFYRTDVDVPATLTVDGTVLREVGVRFRGNSSFFGVPDGQKKSINLSLDAWHPDQRLQGYKTLNLLNGHSDPSFLREVLHAEVARQYVAASRANLVVVVVNGEHWGVFTSAQQFDKDFLDENFGTRKGVRYRVPPSFGGAAAIKDLGDDPARYRAAFQMRGEGDDAALRRLMYFCQVLSNTSDEMLQQVLPTVLDVDGALRFLAVDGVLLDGDGYYSRASDYALYEDPEGRFHLIPYDSNEILGGGGRGPGGPGGPGGGPPGGFPGGPPEGPPPGFGPPDGQGPPDRRGGDPNAQGPGGPGGPGGRGRGGMMGGLPVDAGPLAMIDNPDRPLVGRLLAVPTWRARYLGYVRAIARDGLDWQRVGPFLEGMQRCIAAAVARDTRKLYSTEEFARSLDGGEPAQAPRGRRTLRQTLEQRRAALLAHPDLAGPWPEITELDVQVLPEGKGAHSAAVRVRVADPAHTAAVLLHWTTARRGRYQTLVLHDDGRHGDGAAGDGVFGGSLPDLPAGKKLRCHAEARTEAGGGKAVVFPAAGEWHPRVVPIPKQ